MSVAIVVSPGRAGAESSRSHTSFVCDVFKLAVAQVVIQRISTVARDIDIGQTIVVVIGDGYAHAPPFAGKSGGLRNVREFEAIVLVIERDHRIATLFVAVDSGSVHGDDVEPAVVVTIDQTRASAHRFDNVAFL